MTTAQATPYPFDPSPLREPVSPGEVAKFWQQVKARHPMPASTIVVWVIVGVVGAVVAVPVLTAAIVAAFGLRDTPIGTGFTLSVVAVSAVMVIIGLSALRLRRRGRETAYRLARFAKANGMTYQHQVDDPPLPGMIFQVGDSRRSFSMLRGHSPRFVEFANYRYSTGSGKNRSTHTWGYVAIKLDVPLPNIVLDAVGNNGLGTNLPLAFTRSQRLKLEGDFDRHFLLYCPDGYEADALYLFSPDIMARFIDHAAQLDVEIVDDWMFLYLTRPVSTTDADTWAWLFATVGALMTKFDQWARWRDERLPALSPSSSGLSPAPGMPNAGAPSGQFAAPVGMLTPPPHPGVAPQGRRLKTGISWSSVVLVLLVVAGTVLPRLLPRLFQ